MVAAKEPCETSWQRARGNERGVVIRGLKEGEVVLLDYTLERQLQVPVPMDSNGRFPFPSCTEFRFRKEANHNNLGETYVEIEMS
jgi:hypothetical protein